MSTSSYRDRVVAMYERYNPDKVGDAAGLLERCKGDEENFIQRLVEKYGPEPQQPAAAPAAATAAAGETSSASNRPPSAAASATAPLRLRLSESATFGARHESDDEDDALRLQPMGFQSMSNMYVQQQQPAAVVNPYAQLKHNLANEVGFVNLDDKHRWEDAWLGKLPLGNLRRSWGETEIAAAQGFKFAIHGKPQRWQKRFFVIVPNFLYYFDTDSQNAACKGAVYLDRATITTEEKLQDRKAIVIKPRVYKKPLEVVAGGDVSAFKITFDADKTLEKWREVLEQMTKITAPAAPASGALGQQSSGAVSAASPFSPSSSLMASPQSFRQSQSMGRQTAIVDPAVTNALLQQQQQGVQQQQSDPQLWRPLVQDSVSGTADLFASQSTPFRMPNGGGGVASGASPLQQLFPGGGAIPNTDAKQQQQQQQHVLQRMDSRRFDPQPGSSSLSLQRQQQQVQQQALALQQQQLELAERQRQQAQQNLLQLNIDANDIKSRIKKIAQNRDPTAMVETLLHFIMDNVSNANQLWYLMDSIDSVPKLPDPALAGQSLLLQAASSGVLNQQLWDTVARAGSAIGGNGGGGVLPSQLQQQLMAQQQQQQASGAFASSSSPLASLPNMAPRSSSAFNSPAAAAAAQQQQQQQQRMATSSVSPGRGQVITRLVEEHTNAIDRIRGNQADATANRAAGPAAAAAAAAAAALAPGRPISRSPDRGSAARAPSTSYYSGGGYPSPAQVAAQQQQLYEQMVGPMQSGLVDQPTWDDRMARIRTRKMMVENILNDLPG